MEATVSKGFLIFAENADGHDYVKMAYALALSIKASQQTVTSVSIVTNDKVPKKYQKVFDQVIGIPWYDTAGTKFSAEHRWKLPYVTPYDETIVLDSDMIFTEDITEWWEYCKPYDMRFCSRIKNCKLDTVIDTTHRKAFINNNLPSPYFALHYFKKCDFTFEFYKVLEFVVKNWEWCWDKFAPKNYQNWISMDLAIAVAIELMGCQGQVMDPLGPLEFIHMKIPLQGWPIIPTTWTDAVPYILNSKGELIVGNIKQTKLFHYVEKDFLTKDFLNRLERLNNA
jgi:hypothetical protein